jgi:hypothetical protein
MRLLSSTTASATLKYNLTFGVASTFVSEAYTVYGSMTDTLNTSVIVGNFTKLMQHMAKNENSTELLNSTSIGFIKVSPLYILGESSGSVTSYPSDKTTTESSSSSATQNLIIGLSVSLFFVALASIIAFFCLCRGGSIARKNEFNSDGSKRNTFVSHNIDPTFYLDRRSGKVSYDEAYKRSSEVQRQDNISIDKYSVEMKTNTMSPLHKNEIQGNSGRQKGNLVEEDMY